MSAAARPPEGALESLVEGPAKREGAPVRAAGVVLFERVSAHVALVTLNRPEARNAINGAVAAGLQEAVQRLEREPAPRERNRKPRLRTSMAMSVSMSLKA